MFCAGFEKGGTDACQVRLCLCRCTILVFLCPLISPSFLYLDGLSDPLHVWPRETAAALLWRRTACQRPVAIVCSELWAGERAAPWPRNPASTPKCPGFSPGYLQPWGWETPFVIRSLFSIKPGQILVLQVCFCSSLLPTELSQPTRGSQTGPAMKARREPLSRPCRPQRDFEDENLSVILSQVTF